MHNAPSQQRLKDYNLSHVNVYSFFTDFLVGPLHDKFLDRSSASVFG